MMLENYRNIGLEWLSDYWLCGRDSVAALPVSTELPSSISLPVKLEEVKLPEWGKKVGINECILVPKEVIKEEADWRSINWWYVIYWYAACLAESEYEKANGPIHSYSFELKNWDSRMWRYAWVNRIGMFLNLWAEQQGHEVKRVPRNVEVILTHDLDAIEKTFSIRFKQSVFNLFNAIRCVVKFQFSLAFRKLYNSVRFLFSQAQYNNLDLLCISFNDTLIRRQVINVYGRFYDKDRSLKQILIDPNYDISDPELVSDLKWLVTSGCEIGLHQSTQAWNSANQMLEERFAVEDALGVTVKTCRQHWLKFGFYSTWQSQADAGLREDMTLGFNNQIAFRNGCAIPIDLSITRLIKTDVPFVVIPMVVMDSHLYDYEVMSDEERLAKMKEVLNELVAVNGTASFIWHPHTLNQDYGWQTGFDDLISLCAEWHNNG